MDDTKTLEVEEDKTGLRVDVFLHAMIEGSSRTFIGEIIKQGHLERKINHQEWQKIDKPSHKVERGEIYRLFTPHARKQSELIAEPMELDIVFEDEALLIINKPAGLVVHPGSGNYKGTLVHGLLHHCGENQLSEIGGTERPGIVHRLDKDTSGLMVVAKNDTSHRLLAQQLADRLLYREYEAIVWGKFLQQNLMVDAPIGRHPKKRESFCVRENGREAISYFSGKEVLAKGRFTLVGCKLQTGRTHQIRVHLQHCKHPIVGDSAYGKTRVGKLSERYNKDAKLIAALHEVLAFPRQCLHACSIAFSHPTTQKKLAFTAPMPHDMRKIMNLLQNL